MKIKLYLTVLFCIFLAFPSYSQTSREIKREKLRIKRETRKEILKLYKEGISFYQKNKLAEAKEAFKKILALDPKRKKAKYYLNKKIPFKERRFAKTAAIRKKKDVRRDIAKLYKKGIASYKKNKILEAKETFEEILTLDPKQKRAKYYLRKKIPFKEKSLAKKTGIKEKRDTRRDIVRLYKEGISNYKKGKAAEAKETFEEIIALDPKQKRAKYYLQKKIPFKEKRLAKKMVKKEKKVRLTRVPSVKEPPSDVSELAPTLPPDSSKKVLDENIRYLKPGKGVEFGLLREKALHPNFESYLEYNDNLFLEKDETDYDLITHLVPGVYAYYTNPNHLFFAFYEMDAIIHSYFPKESRVNQSLGGKVYLFKQSPIKITIGDTFQSTTEPATSETTKFIRRANNAFKTEVRYDMSMKTSVALSYDQVVQHYTDSAYKDFSYFQQVMTPTLYWHLSPKTSITADYAMGMLYYYEDEVMDREYDSFYHQVRGGIEGDLTQKSRIHLKGGYQFRNYYDSRVKDTHAFVLESLYSYALTPKTTLEFIVSSNIAESLYADVGYYKSINTYASCRHRLFNNVDISLSGYYIRSDYPHDVTTTESGVRKRSDNLYGVTARLEYKFKNWASAFAQYSYRIKDSNIRNVEYDNNRISSGVKLNF